MFSSTHFPLKKESEQTGHTLSVNSSGIAVRTWPCAEQDEQRPFDGFPQAGQTLSKTKQLTFSQRYHLRVWNAFDANDTLIIDNAAFNATIDRSFAHKIGDGGVL